VGRVTEAGVITRNYVSQDARFRGVSTKLLTALEGRTIERGDQGYTLKSTETARCFCLARGYPEDEPADGKFGTASGHPMSKCLVT
jgi:GNAT superfamily N-acetyltransferase